MPVSSLSMAATAASSFSSKLSNIPFSGFPATIPIQFSAKPKFPKLLKLGIQSPIVSSFSAFYLPPPRCGSASSFEIAAEETKSLEEENPEAESQENPEQEELTVPEGSEEGRLYVGNLPYTMSSNGLAELFGKAGRVLNVEVVYDRVTDRSRGFAFVTMGSVEEAKEAIRMFDGSQVGGRTAKVNFPEVPRGGEKNVLGPKIRESYKAFIDSPHKVYAGNLGWRLTSEGLRSAFANQPGLLSAKVIYERDTGRSRGFGFVSFESADDARSAISAMNGVEVEGRPLRLNLASERGPAASVSERDAESSPDGTEVLTSMISS